MPDKVSRVTFSDCKKLRFCSTGVKAFCLRTGLDYDQLVSVGLEYSELEELNDHYAAALVRAARRRAGG